MATKKVLKVLMGEAYDKETRRNFPVYKSFWQQDDGSYSHTEKVFVSEVQVLDKKEKQKQVDA